MSKIAVIDRDSIVKIVAMLGQLLEHYIEVKRLCSPGAYEAQIKEIREMIEELNSRMG